MGASLMSRPQRRTITEDRMPAAAPLSTAFRDLAEDVAHHLGGLLQVTLDLACLLVLASALYAASLDGTHSPRPGVTAEAANPAAIPQGPCLNGLDPLGSCIIADVLKDPIGT